MERYASMRPTWEHISLFEVISHIEGAQDKDRAAVTERAMRYIDGLENYRSILTSAARLKMKQVEIIEIPASLKVRVDSQLFNAIIDKFRKTFNIERVKVPFLMRVILMAYWQHINSGTKSIQEKIGSEENNDLIVIVLDDRLTLNRKIAELLESTSEEAHQKILKIKRIVEG